VCDDFPEHDECDDDRNDDFECDELFFNDDFECVDDGNDDLECDEEFLDLFECEEDFDDRNDDLESDGIFLGDGSAICGLLMVLFMNDVSASADVPPELPAKKLSFDIFC